MSLEHDAHILGHTFMRAPEHFDDTSGVRRDQAGDDPQQRALATAARTQDRHKLPRRNVDVDSLQRAHLPADGAVGEVQLVGGAREALEAGGSLVVTGFQLAITIAAGLGGLLIDAAGVATVDAIGILLLVIGAALIGAATTTLSTALNFGPTHAFSWTTPLALEALAVGTGAAMLLSLVPPRVAAGFGLIALTALVMLVAQAPADPYFAQSVQGWEQGRFIRFHGAAQWVGWLWPYAALTYLLVRLAARERP